MRCINKKRFSLYIVDRYCLEIYCLVMTALDSSEDVASDKPSNEVTTTPDRHPSGRLSRNRPIQKRSLPQVISPSPAPRSSERIRTISNSSMESCLESPKVSAILFLSVHESSKYEISVQF